MLAKIGKVQFIVSQKWVLLRDNRSQIKDLQAWNKMY